jgi:hypothetical protein
MLFKEIIAVYSENYTGWILKILFKIASALKGYGFNMILSVNNDYFRKQR